MEADGRVVMVFQCNHDPGGCATWDAESGANAVLVLEAGEISNGFTVPPDNEDNDENTKTEIEARVVRWERDEDTLTSEQVAAMLDADAYNDLSENDVDKVYSYTKLGSAPGWVQGPEVPGPPYCFVAQFDMYHRFAGAAPPPEQIGCRVQRETAGGSFKTDPLPSGAKPLRGSPSYVTEYANPEGREWLCEAADYGDAGTAYLFLSKPATPGELPDGKFLWQCG